VVEVYGDWLYERRELPQAATAFIEASKPRKAMVAFEKNLQWREVFDLAFLNDVPEEEVKDMAYRVSGESNQTSTLGLYLMVSCQRISTARSGISRLAKCSWSTEKTSGAPSLPSFKVMHSRRPVAFPTSTVTLSFSTKSFALGRLIVERKLQRISTR
jgi:hypothetical protein